MYVGYFILCFLKFQCIDIVWVPSIVIERGFHVRRLFSNHQSLPWNSRFSSLFSWYAFCCRFKVYIDEILILVILRRFSYKSCSAANLRHIVNVYLSLISLLLSRTSDSKQLLLFRPFSFVGSVVSLLWQFGDRRTHHWKKNMPQNSMRYYSISYSKRRSLCVL